MGDNVSIIARQARELAALGVGEIRVQESLKKHTTWRIGGSADILVKPQSIGQVQKALRFADKEGMPLHIIGGGSNLLISDNGLRGLVLKLSGGLKAVDFNENAVYVEAGVPLPALAALAAGRRLSGLEFVTGIPGTVGGAVVMNAGAHGQQMSQIVDKLTYCDLKGEVKCISAEDAGFTYRGSMFRHNPQFILLAIVCRLKTGDGKTNKEQMNQYRTQRQLKQPTDLPSAGSVFKNPPGHFAGQLIDSVGAKGWRIGDAQVSPKHGNFIVNVGQATSKDVLLLIEKVQNAVWAAYQIELEREVILLGE